jgi:hypothetical protein
MLPPSCALGFYWRTHCDQPLNLGPSCARSGLIRVTAPGEYLLDEQGYLERSTGGGTAGVAGDHMDEDMNEDEDVSLSCRPDVESHIPRTCMPLQEHVHLLN